MSAALALSFLESRLPPIAPVVPGVKIGLANVAVIYALCRLGVTEAIIVSIVRVAVSSLLFGNAAGFIYSFAGAAVSLFLMALLKRIFNAPPMTLGVVGGVSHNLAQIGVACLLLGTGALIYYLPALLLFGVVSGIVTGSASSIVCERVKGVQG